MIPLLLLDTHVVVRWLSAPQKLSREQKRALGEARRRGNTVAISAFSLVEIAMMSQRSKSFPQNLDEIFAEIETNPIFVILPLTVLIAREAAALRILRDPGDRIIVGTARIHNLRLLTSDQRIIDSRLAAVID